MRQSLFRFSLCLVVSMMSIIHVWAQGPEMNKVYTVTEKLTTNWSYDTVIKGSYFNDSAEEIVIKVTNANYVQFRLNGQAKQTYEWEDRGVTAICKLTGTDIKTAHDYGVNVYFGNNSSGAIIVTVLNKDANYVEPGTGGDPGNDDNNNDPDYTPDYTNQLDSDGDGKLEPCSDYPAFGALVDYNKFPQLTDIPTIYLTTDNTFSWNAQTPKSEEYVSASIVIVDKDGTMKQRNETVTFRGRGNSTWESGSKKKPWRLKFPEKTKLLAEQDANYNEINNYADAKSWTLLCNVYDKSLIRNAVSAELGKRYGMEFCPAYRFVDLVINGQYQGTYQVSDHVQVDKKRVNVDSKTGWFVEFSTQKFAEDPYVSVQAGWQSVLASIKNPETSVVTASGATTDSQFDAMKEWLGTMWTNLCNGTNEYDTNRKKAYYKAFRDMVDMKSLTGFVILQDLAGNYDGAMANVYAYKNATDEKLKFGPIWDLDLAYGNYSTLSNQHFWEAQSQGIGFLFANMWKDPYFVKALYENWLAFKDGDNMMAFINGTNGNNGKIDELATRIALSQAANYNTAGDTWRQGDNAWSISSALSLGHGATSYADAIQEIKDYISARSAWMTNVYKQQYTALECDSLNPCTDFGHNDSYVLQTDGSYRKGCDVCDTLSTTDTQTYYLFTIYPESKKATTQYATRWQPSAEKPNSIAVVEATKDVVERIEGYNIIAGKKTLFPDGEKYLTCKDFRLTDGHPYYSENKFVAATATYSRSISNKWGTIILPYKFQNASTDDADFFHLSDATINGSEGTLVFTPIKPEIDGDASAYTPVVFRAKKGKNKLVVNGEDITVKKSDADKTNSTVDGWTLVGTVEQTVFNDVSGSSLYYIYGDKFWHATGRYTSNPFRAYFLNSSSAQAAASFRLTCDDDATGITDPIADGKNVAVFVEQGGVTLVSSEDKSVNVHSISGALVRKTTLKANIPTTINLPSGIYTVNGVKVNIR